MTVDDLLSEGPCANFLLGVDSFYKASMNPNHPSGE